MPIQLEVRPEITDKLTALARARGVSVDELLRAVLDELEPGRDSTTAPSLEEFERDMDAIAEGLEHLSAEYQGTYSRKDIYMDQD